MRRSAKKFMTRYIESFGKGKIGKFLQSLARPHVLKEDLTSAYQAMAADTDRELAALEWSDGLISGSKDAEI